MKGLLVVIADWLDGIRTATVETCEGPVEFQYRKGCSECVRNLFRLGKAHKEDFRREATHHHFHMLTRHGV